MRLFLDTSILVRYFTNDDLKKSNQVKALLSAIEAGRIRPYTSSIVIAELIFVLMRLYKLTKVGALEKVEVVLRMRNMGIEERTDSGKALKLFKELAVKYGDCLIATQIPKGAAICTYDEDFGKIPGVQVVDAGDVTV